MPLTVKQYVQILIDSGLMTLDEIREFRDSLPAEKRIASVETLQRELVKQGRLTSYQASRVAEGRPKGLVLGKNVIVEKIGEGGMGEVFLAEHRVMKRPVVVKVLPEAAMESDYARKRFQQEVEAAAQLSHPNIVTAFDADQEDGVHFLVMEYVNGDDLATMVEKNGHFSVQRTVDCALQAARGLEYAHAKGIVHRDIKPENLLMDSAGAVKILDMGLARMGMTIGGETRDDGLTRDNQIIGTVDYMSPEQADDSAHVDQRSDIYSLGCTMYRLLTGIPPYTGSTIIKKLVAHRLDPIPSLREKRTDVPEKIDAVFRRMVEKKPADRYQSMTELIRDLQECVDDTDFDVGDSAGKPAPYIDTATPTRIIDKEDPQIAAANQDLQPKQSVTVDMSGDQLTVDTDLNINKDTLSEGRVGSKDLDVASLGHKAVGVDLGTTFSAIAYLDDLGRPQTLMNAEGDKTTPSVLLFEDEEVIVGKEAVKAMATDMEMIAECAKRDLGRRMFHKTLGDKQFPPEVLQAWILNKLRDDAQRIIGEFSKVVITVPAYFDETRRKATQDAGYVAGFDVMDIINEPTAAALAYGFHQGFIKPEGGGEKRRILVYDLGGGTFDVTIMETDGRDFIALATDGDVRLGGRDWDDRLLNFVADQFLAEHDVDPREDANTFGRLWRGCEDAKRTLSTRNKTTIDCDYQGKSSLVNVSRAEFEEMTDDLLGRTEFTIRQTMQTAKMTWDDIDHLLLVGGSTRMPAVVELLKRMSGKEPDRSVSPDEAVAHGAAIRAAILLDRHAGKSPKLNIINVNSHNLGVVGTDRDTGRRQTAVLIPRNTALPVTAEQTFYTHKENQKSVLVQIVEGESENPEECAQVGKCAVRDLPKNVPAQTPIKVHFHYKENGRLTVRVKVKGTEKFVRQEITRENSLDRKQLDHWRKRVSGLEPLRTKEQAILDKLAPKTNA